MEQSQLNWIAGFIWGIADDVLRDLYVRGKYRDVILPMMVLRRLDAVLEPTKQAVLDMKASLDRAGITHQDAALRQEAGQAFYNTSKFTLRDLRARTSQQQLKADFEAYLDGFSPNVQEILENFEFRNQIPRLSKADALGTLIEKLLDASINLSPNPVMNGDGSVKHPGLDNHAMGTIFEELVRRFNEENNEEADEIVGGPEYSTLSNDAFPPREFDFMLSNPPYGKSWKSDMERMGGKGGIKDSRFLIEHADDPEYSLITRSSDGQMLFLANMLSKMKQGSKLGSRITEVHNGSSLFTGDAGQGESNIRRWIIENNWLEAIVALPLNMFYNTGIATYIWVLTNRKPAHRKGKVQLIDATQWFKPLRKNLGKKNCELSDEDIQYICETFLDFKETGQSKIFPNAAFGYWKVTVERPLRLKVGLGDERRRTLRRACLEADEEPIANVADRLVENLGPGPHTDFNAFLAAVEHDADQHGVKLTAKRKKLLQTILARRDEGAREVTARIHKPGKVEADPLHGLFEVFLPSPSGRGGGGEGQRCVVEYEPDPDLRDTEQVPLLEEGGIEAFLRREVLPHAPDAWYVPDSVKTGYEISFTRYFYKPQPLRTLEEIRADILAMEKETEGMLDQILGRSLEGESDDRGI